MSEAPRPIGKVGAPSALRYLHKPRILQVQDPGVGEDGWAFPALVELVLNTRPAKVAASTARGVETALGTPGVRPKAPCRCLPEHPGFPRVPVPEEGCDTLCNSHGAAWGHPVPASMTRCLGPEVAGGISADFAQKRPATGLVGLESDVELPAVAEPVEPPIVGRWVPAQVEEDRNARAEWTGDLPPPLAAKITKHRKANLPGSLRPGMVKLRVVQEGNPLENGVTRGRGRRVRLFPKCNGDCGCDAPLGRPPAC